MIKTPEDFRVVALMAVRNESDVLGVSLEALSREGIGFFVLDDHSSDGSLEIARGFEGRGLIGTEVLGGTGEQFSLRRIIARKEELSRQLEASWFINHDADEFREGPWPGVGLRDSIFMVDQLGYSAVDFLVFDYWPTGEEFRPGMDPRQVFEWTRANVEGNLLQIRCWKNLGGPLDLVSSAGHEAVFPGRKVFPIRFVLRHYPFRGFRHAEFKLFQDRRHRYDPEERSLGWHQQYEEIQEPEDLRIPKENLEKMDPLRARLRIWLEPRGKISPRDLKLFQDGLLRERDLLSRELDQSNRVNERLSTFLSETEERCAEKERAIAEWRGESRRLRREVEKRSETIEGLRARIGELEKEHQILLRQKRALERDVDELHQSSGDFEKLKRELEVERDAVQAERDRLVVRTEELEREMRAGRRAIEDLQRRLLAMENSYSWKVTIPFRWFLHLLRGY